MKMKGKYSRETKWSKERRKGWKERRSQVRGKVYSTNSASCIEMTSCIGGLTISVEQWDEEEEEREGELGLNVKNKLRKNDLI